MTLRFSRIYKHARRPEHLIPADFGRDAFVIFSDQHKGDGSGADDFKANAGVYKRALTHYAAAGFRLIVLGDSEDCWECRLDRIFRLYGDLIQREIDLAVRTPARQKVRIWGNHDKELAAGRLKKLGRKQRSGPYEGITFREGLCLGPDIFLVHGHQGHFFEDQAWKVSRWAVQLIWKSVQRIFRIGSEGPSTNARLRERLEVDYYRWAKKKRLLLICGHTHRAIFASQTHFDPDAAPGRDIPLEARPRRPVPCSFNSGCCCYTDGITGIEIEKGLIRLVLWRRLTGERKILAEEKIEQILVAIKQGRDLAEAD
jgi:predicted phosphodiesterase